MTAGELFKAGELAGAVEAALQAVKKEPTNPKCRWVLAEFLCFANDLERADNQLDVIFKQANDKATAVSGFRQLIRAEQVRRDVFEQGRVPDLLGDPTPALRLALEAFVAGRAGDAAGAAALLRQAETERKPTPCRINGTTQEDFRDLDDFWGAAGLLEVLTSTGRYFWVPVENVESLEFTPIAHPRDLLWREAKIAVNNGPNGVVHIPALYPGTSASTDVPLKLGRATDWNEEQEISRGVGQRMYLLGEDAAGIAELQSVLFSDATPVQNRREG